MTVPEGWGKVDLNRIAKVNRGLTWSRSQESHEPTSDSVPVLRIPNIQQSLDLTDILYINDVNYKKRSKHLAQKGWSIMVGSNGNPDRVGNCVFMSEDTDFLFASFLVGIESLDSNQLTPEFLYRLLSGNRIQKSISQSVQGSTGLRNISLRMLRSEQVLLPPLPEQKKIAAILSSVDETIQATRETIEQTKKVKQGLMQELLTRGIGHTKFKKTEIGEIPESWEAVKLSEAVSSDAPITYGIVQAGPHIPDGVPYVRVTDMKGNQLSAEGMLCTHPSIAANYARTKVSVGDVIYALRGEIGKVLQIPETLEGANLSRGTALIRSGDRLRSRFLYWALNGQNAREQARIESTGSTFKELMLKRLKTITVPLPSIPEQDNIVETLDVLENSERAAESSLEVKLDLKKGLMQDLLTGKVRVAV